MFTNYEKYLVLTGMHVQEVEEWRQDQLADAMDKLWNELSPYQRNLAKKGVEFANRITADRLTSKPIKP